MDSFHWDRNLKIRLTGETIFNLFYWMYFPYMAVYFSQSLGVGLAGILMIIPPIISLVFNLIGGYLADSIGRRPLLLAGAAIQTMMFGVFAMSASPWLDYVAFLTIGIGGALYKPASEAMVADLVEEPYRKKVFATFITFNNIGAVLGPIFGAILFFEYRSILLWICTIILLLYTLLIFMEINETNPRQPLVANFSNISLLKNQWNSYRIIFSDKYFMYYIIAGIFSVMAIMQLDLYLAIYISKFLPLQTFFSWGRWSFEISGTEALGWMLGLNGLLFVIFILPVSNLLKNWSDRNVFVLSCLLAGLGMFAVAFTTNIWLLLCLTVIFTFGEIVKAPVLYNFVSTHAPKEARGQYMGAANLQFTVGRFFAPMTIIASAWLPPIGVFGIILGCAVISGTFYIKLYTV